MPGCSPGTARIPSIAPSGERAATFAPTWGATSPSHGTQALRTGATSATSSAAVDCGSSRLPSGWPGCSRESGVHGADETLVIPNGADTAVFHPGSRADARERLGLPADAQVLLVVANSLATNPFKDARTLQAALSTLAEQCGEPPRLVVLGGAEGLSVDGLEVRSVPFTDDRETVASYYRAADIYVHAARAENLPLTIIEAMACGIAVVASSVGGIPELVVDSQTGLLVPAGDAGALARAISNLLCDDETRRTYGEVGAKRARERFTLEREADSYLALYEELQRTWRADV